MATLGPTGTAVPPLPTTYHQLYMQQTDVLDGHNACFFSAFHVMTGNTADELFDAVVSLTQRVPKMLLARVTLVDNTQHIMVIHRPSMYEHDLVEPAPAWNDCAIAFTTDIDANSRFIGTTIFPVTAFSLTDIQTVPTMADMDAQVNATVTATIGPYTTGSPNTEDIRTRNMMPVPPKYLDLVSGKIFTPCKLWRQLATTIINDGLAADCAPLLDWIRVAGTRRHNTPPNSQPPANHLGSITTVFPTATEDRHLARHRWEIIKRDLPVFGGPASLAPNNQIIHMFGALRQDHAANRAADEARRLADKQDKLPSATKYKHVVRDWMQFCSVLSETDLPPIYQLLANTDKAEHITLLCNAVCECARSAGAAPTNAIAPVVSKEVKDMVLSCQYGVPTHEINNLKVGLQPFSVRFFLGDELGCIVELRAANYNLMMAGHKAPTVEEQANFSTKKVRIPTNPFVCGIMLATTSILVDVVQGIHHPFAIAFRSFCTLQWPSLATLLMLARRRNPHLCPVIVPRILRWVQTNMVTYFQQLLVPGSSAVLPPFQDLTRIVSLAQYAMLPELPDTYRIPPTPDTRGKPNPTPASTTTATPPPPSATILPASAPTAPTTTRNQGHAGALVTNPNLVTDWKRALEASNKKIRNLVSTAPNSTDKSDDNKAIPLCLSYHLRGSCYSNCNRLKTHRALAASESTSLEAMVQAQLIHSE